MGTITRSFANNLTTSGVLLPASLTNNSIANVTAYNAAIATGNMVLISSQTASASASISFTTGIDSTYKEYQFYFIDMHPATDGTAFSFQGNAIGQTGYNETITSAVFLTHHNESDTATSLQYVTSMDQAQGTSFQQIGLSVGNDNDQSFVGDLTIFNPSSTTFVKHFISRTHEYYSTDYARQYFTAGYFNTTSAIDEIQFKFASGNIDAGTILLYGIK